MSRRGRRLWLGDWQRDDPGQGDTVVFLPEDDEGEAAPKPERPHNRRRVLAGLAAIAVLCALVVVVASGGDDKPVTSARPAVPPAQTTPTPTPQVPQSPVPQGGFGGADLTGPAATKAAKAALAKYPGEIERVTRGPGGGGYVVHVFQPDGNEVHVIVSDEFKVLGSDAPGGAPPPAPGGGSTNPS